jgi:hypothetical protein
MSATFDEPSYTMPSIKFIRLIASGFLQEVNQRKAAETLAKLFVEKYIF